MKNLLILVFPWLLLFKLFKRQKGVENGTFKPFVIFIVGSVLIATVIAALAG